MKIHTLPILVGLVGLSAARTDISGCVSSATTDQWHEASMIWYVPGSGEICDFIDCGGGRAPPKTDQPGCPLYTGTATVTPSYLPGYGPNGKMVATTTTVSETSTTTMVHTTIISSAGSSSDSAESSSTIAHQGNTMVTAAPTSSPVVSMTKTTSPSSKAGNSTSTAPTSTETGNAAVIPSSNVAGVMAIAAAVLGVFAL